MALHEAYQEEAKRPYPDFPLFPHAVGQWAKKIRGKMHYFGPWRDPYAALSKYHQQRADLHAAGVAGDTLAVGGKLGLVNRFLTNKLHLVDTRELSPRTWADYKLTCDRLIAYFGERRLVADLVADEFEKLRESWPSDSGQSRWQTKFSACEPCSSSVTIIA